MSTLIATGSASQLISSPPKFCFPAYIAKGIHMYPSYIAKNIEVESQNLPCQTSYENNTGREKIPQMTNGKINLQKKNFYSLLTCNP
jgi:hypothetical protein